MGESSDVLASISSQIRLVQQRLADKQAILAQIFGDQERLIENQKKIIHYLNSTLDKGQVCIPLEHQLIIQQVLKTTVAPRWDMAIQHRRQDQDKLVANNCQQNGNSDFVTGVSNPGKTLLFHKEIADLGEIKVLQQGQVVAKDGDVHDESHQRLVSLPNKMAHNDGNKNNNITKICGTAMASILGQSLSCSDMKSNVNIVKIVITSEGDNCQSVDISGGGGCSDETTCSDEGNGSSTSTDSVLLRSSPFSDRVKNSDDAENESYTSVTESDSDQSRMNGFNLSISNSEELTAGIPRAQFAFGINPIFDINSTQDSTWSGTKPAKKSHHHAARLRLPAGKSAKKFGGKNAATLKSMKAKAVAKGSISESSGFGEAASLSNSLEHIPYSISMSNCLGSKSCDGKMDQLYKFSDKSPSSMMSQQQMGRAVKKCQRSKPVLVRAKKTCSESCIPRQLQLEQLMLEQAAQDHEVASCTAPGHSGGLGDTLNSCLSEGSLVDGNNGTSGTFASGIFGRNPFSSLLYRGFLLRHRRKKKRDNFQSLRQISYSVPDITNLSPDQIMREKSPDGGQPGQADPHHRRQQCLWHKCSLEGGSQRDLAGNHSEGKQTTHAHADNMADNNGHVSRTQISGVAKPERRKRAKSQIPQRSSKGQAAAASNNVSRVAVTGGGSKESHLPLMSLTLDSLTMNRLLKHQEEEEENEKAKLANYSRFENAIESDNGSLLGGVSGNSGPWSMLHGFKSGVLSNHRTVKRPRDVKNKTKRAWQTEPLQI